MKIRVAKCAGRKTVKFLQLAIIVVGFVPSSLMAQETTIYEYDALGRLVTTNVSGGPSDGVEVDAEYDAAGNRTEFDVTGADYTSPFDVLLIPISGGKVVAIIY
jgi:YD repeat-containing protein